MLQHIVGKNTILTFVRNRQVVARSDVPGCRWATLAIVSNDILRDLDASIASGHAIAYQALEYASAAASDLQYRFWLRSQNGFSQLPFGQRLRTGFVIDHGLIGLPCFRSTVKQGHQMRQQM